MYPYSLPSPGCRSDSDHLPPTWRFLPDPLIPRHAQVSSAESKPKFPPTGTPVSDSVKPKVDKEQPSFGNMFDRVDSISGSARVNSEPKGQERVAPSLLFTPVAWRAILDASLLHHRHHGLLQLLQTLHPPPPHYRQLNSGGGRGSCLLRGPLWPQNPRPPSPGPERAAVASRVRGRGSRHSLRREMLGLGFHFVVSARFTSTGMNLSGRNPSN